jgi:hypothetical protein
VFNGGEPRRYTRDVEATSVEVQQGGHKNSGKNGAAEDSPKCCAGDGSWASLAR